jgi:hypothetical protein
MAPSTMGNAVFEGEDIVALEMEVQRTFMNFFMNFVVRLLGLRVRLRLRGEDVVRFYTWL